VKKGIIVGFVNKQYDSATAVLYFSVFSFCFPIGGFVAIAKPQAAEWRNHIQFIIEPALAKERLTILSKAYGEK
jgi:hypothetical protein